MTRSIRKGTALLDREYPGWYDAINLDELALESASSCVLGQLAHYHVGLDPDDGDHLDFYDAFVVEELGMSTYDHDDERKLEELGFFVDDVTPEERARGWIYYDVYADLTERWKRAVRRRRRRSE